MKITHDRVLVNPFRGRRRLNFIHKDETQSIPTPTQLVSHGTTTLPGMRTAAIGGLRRQPGRNPVGHAQLWHPPFSAAATLITNAASIVYRFRDRNYLARSKNS